MISRYSLMHQVGVLSLLASSFAFCSSAAGEEISTKDEPRIARVLAAWKQRESAIHSIEATIELAMVMNASSRGRPGVGIAPGANQGTPVEYKQEWSFALDLVNLRYRSDGKGGMYHASRGQTISFHSIATFADGEGKSYFATSLPGLPDARIENRRPVMLNLDTFASQPLRQFVRPFGLAHNRFDEVLKHMKVSGIERHDDSYLLKCLIPAENGFVWIDEGRGHVVTRVVGIRRNSKLETSIEYGTESAFGPFPLRAMSIHTENGKVFQQETVEVKDIQINVPMGEVKFDFQFPVGVVVSWEGKGRYRVDSLGQLIPVEPDERNRPNL